MKKILWFVFGFVLAAGLGAMIWNTWATARYFEANGRAGTLKVGKKYNASRWSSPIPFKKLHTYTAVLAPNHEVLVESDQDLEENKEYFIRFLLRDRAVEGRKLSLRPLAGAIRLKSEADGTPVKLADTDLFDSVVTKAMGPMGEGYYERPKAVAEAAPSHSRPTVPYLLAGAGDPVLEVIWNNSTLGEWLVAAIWVFIIQIALLQGWSTPFNPNRRVGSERKDFVHPSMRRIEADKTEASPKITYAPKPEDPDFVPDPPKPRTTLPAPASTTASPAVPASVSTAATAAPFVPPAAAGETEPALKLKRKPKTEAKDRP